MIERAGRGGFEKAGRGLALGFGVGSISRPSLGLLGPFHISRTNQPGDQKKGAATVWGFKWSADRDRALIF